MNRPLPPLPHGAALRLDEITRAARLPPDAQTALSLVLRASLLEPEEEPSVMSRFEVTRTQIDQGPETADIFGPAPEAVRPDLGRYQELGLLGRGGAGEVWRAYDPVLNRVVALKVLRRPQARAPAHLARFRAEAQVAAALAHPYVVEVYEAGELPDGRFYYTMEEIQGRTLREMITEAHQGLDGMPEATLRELVRVLRDAALAVAYAHDHGVIHRDLKPSNIMVERNGAVCVLDWGLFGYIERPPGALGAAALEPKPTDAPRAHDDVAGTPPYMAPEQLSGAREAHGPWTDIYALGAILFQILAGFPPVRATSMSEVARQVHSGWREPLIARHPIPEPLRRVCESALVPAPSERLQDATRLAEELEAWLSRTEDEERAQRELQEADEVLAEISRARARVASLRYAAQRHQAARPSPPMDELRERWALDDEADRLEEESEARRAVLEVTLRGALARDPELSEARARLARLDDGLRRPGEGLLTLHTDPPGASVILRPLGASSAAVARALGPTPLVSVAVPAGSWLLTVSAPRRAPMMLPVLVVAGERTALPREGGAPLRLPTLGELGPLDRLVPEGSTLIGGDPQAPNSGPRRRMHVASFVMRATPLSEADLRPGGDPLQPAHGLSFDQAQRLAAEIAQREGLPWRLPTELEWERAARGADGRAWPWGDALEPLRSATSAAGCRGPAPLGQFPGDISVFGVEGLAGNIADWCTTGSGEAVARGGMWAAPPNAGRCAARHRLGNPTCGWMVGLRLARSWPGP